MIWAAVLGTALGCYLFKVLGLSLPERWLRAPRVERIAAALPVALLAALVAVQAVADGNQLRVDARLTGLAAGAVAVVLRAPFLVVVAVAAGVAAAVRSLP
jgi:branched-subunit amino acid transport protein